MTSEESAGQRDGAVKKYARMDYQVLVVQLEKGSNLPTFGSELLLPRRVFPGA